MCIWWSYHFSSNHLVLILVLPYLPGLYQFNRKIYNVNMLEDNDVSDHGEFLGFPDGIFKVPKDIWQRQGTHFVVEPLKFQWKVDQVAV